MDNSEIHKEPLLNEIHKGQLLREDVCKSHGIKQNCMQETVAFGGGLLFYIQAKQTYTS